MQADRWRWRIVWLLFLATMINYMDRLALGNAERYILPEFAADAKTQNLVYGRMNLYFGISFAVFQVIGGVLIDRYSLRRLYLGAVLLWSAAGIATGFVPAGAIGLLIACRVALGVGEAFNWPCAVATIRRVVPRESRGLANGIFHSGASIGAILTPLLVLLVVKEWGFGWRTLFILVGSLGFVWLTLWWRVTASAEPILDDPAMETPGTPTPFRSVTLRKTFLICLVTGCSVNLCWHFYNQWFPRYLREEVNASESLQQWTLAGFYLAADLGSLLSGWMIRKLIRGGFAVERARQVVMSVLAIGVVTASIPATNVPFRDGGAVFFFAVAAFAMGGFAIFFSLAQDIAGEHTAKILGICGAISWLLISGVANEMGSYAAPGTYGKAFMAVGYMPMIAAAAGWFWTQRKPTDS